MTLNRYIALFRARWWLIVIITLICAAASYGVSTRVLQKQYTASATFEVNNVGTQSSSSSANQVTPGQVATDAQLPTSYPVVEKTVADLKLGAILTPNDLLGHISCSPSDVAQTFTCTVTYKDRVLAIRILNQLGNNAIATNIANQTQQLKPLINQVDQQITNTQADLSAAQAALRQAGADTAGLQARIDTDINTLTQLKQSKLTLQQDLAAQQNSMILIDPARAPDGPTSPRPLVNTLFAALVGLMLGIGGVLLADYLDDSPRSPEHLATELGAPIFASLPRVSRRRGQLPEMVVSPHSDAAEAYRILRTSIRFANVDAPIRSLLVTSSNPGEGKTTAAANLAVTFAQAGVRVVLIDADLRRPTIHEAFNLDNTVGLTSILFSQRELQWSDVLQQGPVPRLQILTAGPLPPNPAELLSSRRMHRVMEHLRGWAELIIIDSPPLLPVADPVVLALMTDAVLLVTDVEHSSMHAMQRAREALVAVGSSVSGIVLNKVPRGKSAYYYYGDTPSGPVDDEAQDSLRSSANAPEPQSLVSGDS